MSKLRPCPFCGGKAKVIDKRYVACSGCGVRTPVYVDDPMLSPMPITDSLGEIMIPVHMYTAKEKCIIHWNDRVGESLKPTIMRQRKLVEKKILPEYYQDVVNFKKNFELRKDEDDIQIGDILLLREWTGTDYTGRETIKKVTYVLRNCEKYGLKPGYCIISWQ